MELRILKEQIRKEIILKRDLLNPGEVNDKSQKVFEYLVEMKIFKESSNIFTYLSFKNEVKTDKIINHSLKCSKNVYIPLCNTAIKELVVCKMDSWRDLEPSKFGILEPKIENIKIGNREDIDLTIVPGVVFDRKGNRIGYGAGYYDKFFSSLKNDICKIGICYSFQIIDTIVPSSYDVPVDYLVTEKEIIKCS